MNNIKIFSGKPQDITLYVELNKLGYPTDFLKSVLVTTDDHNLNFLVKYMDRILSSLLFFFLLSFGY